MPTFVNQVREVSRQGTPRHWLGMFRARHVINVDTVKELRNIAYTLVHHWADVSFILILGLGLGPQSLQSCVKYQLT